jgi:hypothetical protein
MFWNTNFVPVTIRSQLDPQSSSHSLNLFFKVMEYRLPIYVSVSLVISVHEVLQPKFCMYFLFPSCTHSVLILLMFEFVQSHEIQIKNTTIQHTVTQHGGVKWSPHTQNNTYNAGTITTSRLRTLQFPTAFLLRLIMANCSRNILWIVLCDKVLWNFRFYKLYLWKHVARETAKLKQNKRTRSRMLRYNITKYVFHALHAGNEWN